MSAAPAQFAGLPNIPALNELKKIPQWVAWTYEDRGGPKPTKPPMNPHIKGRHASCDDPATWGTYEQAERRAREDGLAGVGFVLSEDDNLTGYDFDNCFTHAGRLKPWAFEILAHGETYAEISPSGKGVRLIARGKIASATKCDPAGVEVYGHGRYVTITGQHREGSPHTIGLAPKTKAASRARAKLHSDAWAALRRAGPKLFNKAATTTREPAAPKAAKVLEFPRATNSDSFWRSVNTAAVQNPSAWVPMVFGSDAKPTAAGGYRVTSRALERQLQEDLSFHPDGVMDWGLERGLTPIDVVIQHGSAPDAPTAALWLCERMGKDPASLGWRGGSKRGGPGEAGQEEKDAALDYMNKKYAVVQIGGKMRIAYFEPSPVFKGVDTIVYSDKTNFIALRERERVQVIAQNGITKSVGIGRWWLAHERRRQYERVAFDPGCTDRETFNLWQGFSCEPVKGDCGLYLDHLSQNVCNGDKEHFTYLLNWMARAVQDPGTQGEVAVVLRGKEGTGKGIAIGQFGKLFGAHFLQVSQPRHLVGNFNGPLQSVSVLFADEAFFAGDRSHEGVLKALVTEPTLQIEIKGVEPVTARNALHIMMSSNSAWVVPAGADARRFFCLDVSDRRKQDTTYFDAIVRQMDNGGREALLHELLARDLSDFNVRKVPITDMLEEQQSYSRRGVDALAYILADSGELPCALMKFPHIAMTSGESKGEGFIPEAHRLVPDLKRLASTTIKKELRDKYGCTHHESNGRTGIAFPPLKKLRAMFPTQEHWGEGDVWATPAEDPDTHGYR